MLKFFPSLRRAIAIRNRLIESKLNEAWRTFAGGDTDNAGSKVRCVVNKIVERESILAKKQDIKPDRISKSLFDEIAGFLNAGYETTSTALALGMKCLTVYQDVQQKLREALRDEHKEAVAAGEPPSPEAIAKVHVPYLEAFMEESMRHAALVSANIRLATMDTEVLGYMIPKVRSKSWHIVLDQELTATQGTDLWMLVSQCPLS